MPDRSRSELTPEQRRKRKLYRKRRKVIFPVSRISFLLTILLSVIFFIILRHLGAIPGKWVAVFGILLLAINIYVASAALPARASNSRKLRQIFISVIMCVMLLFGSIAMPLYKGKLAKVFNPMPSQGELNINVYTLKDSQFTKVQDLAGVPVAVQSRLDKEFQDYALIQVNRELKEPVITKECRDVYSAVDMLYEGNVAAVMFNESYVSLLTANEDYQDFEDKVQLIFQCVQKVEFQYDIEAVGNITTQPFVIGVLGNDEDTLKTLSNTGGFRSDVNILCVVNPTTKQVLVITVPRDSYVSVDGNSSYKDKLTHSPIYNTSSKSGIGYWISTMNTLLDCKINYTLKVNFISVVKIVNALGGIDINNPSKFTTKTTHPVFSDAGKMTGKKKYTFAAGDLHLDGNQTLAYCRERYGLSGGDFDRNKHQAIVLKALIRKATEPAILTKANSLLKAMEGSFLTNMTVDEMFALAQMQLDDLASWDVKTYAVSGSVDYLMCYQLGTEASVAVLDNKSLKKAQKLINQILSNEIVTLD